MPNSTAITTITLTATAANTMLPATVTGLPSGLTYTHAADGKTATISGTPGASANITVGNAISNIYTVTNSVTNAAITPLSATHNTAYSGTLTANTGYTRPASITMTIGGSNYTGFTYTQSTGAITIPAAAVTGNIVISGTAPVAQDLSKIYVKSTGNDSTGDGTFAKPFATLATAYGKVTTGGEIRVLSNLTITAGTNFNSAKTVTVQSYSNETAINTTSPFIIKRGFVANSALIGVNAGNVTLKNIIIDGNGASDTDSGGTSIYNKAVLKLSDGFVLQNTTIKSINATAVAGAIHMDGGTLTIESNAKLQNNKIISANGRGAAMYASNGVVNIGGTASITNNSASQYGGGIYMNAGTVNIGGSASISGNNAATNGGGVYVENGTINVSGSPKITGNTQGANTNNVYLATNKTITISGRLTAGADIGVNMQSMPTTAGAKVNVATGAVSGEEAYFKSDKATEAGVIFESNIIKLSYDAREGDRVLIWSPKLSTQTNATTFVNNIANSYTTLGAKVTKEAQSNTVKALLDLATVNGSKYTPNFDLLFVVLPTVAASQAEIDELNRFLAAGGRIVFIGESPDVYEAENTNLQNLAKALGAEFTITNKQVPINAVNYNLDSPLTTGFDVAGQKPNATQASRITYSGKSQWVLCGVQAQNIWCVDQAAGSIDGHEKGRITVISDIDWGTTYISVATQFLKNLLKDSKDNIETVAGGGDPNGGIATVAAQIDDATFETLEAAIAAATAGQTITLLKDIDETVTVSKSITIDGGNFTNSSTITIDGDCDVTLKNMKTPTVTLTNSGKVTIPDNTVTDANITINSAGSRVNVDPANQPANINITAEANAVIGQTLVQSTTVMPPNAGKITLTNADKGLLAESTYLKLGAKVTITFPGSTGGNGVTGDKWTFVTDGINTKYGDKLPTPPTGELWEDEHGNIINANTPIPTTAPTVKSESIGAYHPIEIEIDDTTYYFDSFDDDSQAYDNAGNPTGGKLADLWDNADTLEIVLYNDIEITKTIEFPDDCEITLTSHGDGGFTQLCGTEGLDPMIRVPEGTTLTIDGVNIDGAGKADVVIENNGTLNLEKGKIETGRTDAHAVVQNNTDEKSLNMNGLDFSVPDKIYLSDGATLHLTDRPTGGALIIVELETPDTGQEVVTHEGYDGTDYTPIADHYSDGYGTVKLVNSGVTLTQPDGPGSPLVTTGSSAIAAIRKGTEVDNNGTPNPGTPDGYTYGYTALDEAIGDHNQFGTYGDTIYVVNSGLAIGSDVEIPESPTAIMGANRVVSGQYGTDVTIENVGSPSGSRTITITGCPVTFEPAENGNPKLNYKEALDAYVAANFDSSQYTSEQWEQIQTAIAKAKSDIEDLAVPNSSYGDIADLINICIGQIEDASVQTGVNPKTGDGFITVNPSDSDKQYVLVGKDGKVAQVKPGNDEEISFEGLTPGEEYTVVVVNGLTPPITPGGSKPTTNVDKEVTATTPAIGGNAGVGIDDGEAFITINPSSPKAKYAVANPDGTLASGWKKGNGGAITFDGLDASEEYIIVALPDDGDYTMPNADLDDNDSKVEVKTPSTDLENVDPDSIDRSDDGTTITIEPINPDQEYAVVDPETGEIVLPYGDWQGDDPVVFYGLDPDKEYEVITREKGDGTNPPSLPAYPGISVLPGLPEIAPPTGPSVIGGGNDIITINPTDKDTWYAVVDAETGVIVGGGWKNSETGGILTFDGLDDSKEYKVVSKPKTDNTKPTVTNPIGGTTVVTAPDAVDKNDITREDAGNGTDTIIIEPTEPDYEYAVVPKNDKPDSWDWQDGGDTITVDNLDPDTEYEVVVRVKNGDGKKLTNRTKVSKRTDAQAGVDPKSGDGYIEVTADTDTKYAVLDKDGNPAAGVDAYDQDGHKLDSDDNGWYSVGEDQVVTFKPLSPGTEYEVVNIPVDDDTSLPEDEKDGGKTTTIPAIGGNAGAGIDGDGDAFITIDPSNPNTKYAVADPDTGELVSGWKNDPDGGVITFDDLTPDTPYIVVALPDDSDYAHPDADLADNGSKVDVKTPTTDFEDVDRDSVGRSEDGTTISVSPTKTGQEYAVVDPETGEIVQPSGDWQSGDTVIFYGLEPDKEYEVITREKGNPPTTPPSLPALPGISVLPGLPEIALPDGSSVIGGDNKTITINPTDDDTWYAVVDGEGKVVGGQPGGWKNSDGGGILTFEDLDDGTEYKVITKPKTDNNEPQINEPVSGGTTVVTAPDAVDKKDITRVDVGANTDTIGFPTDTEYEYAVVPKGTNPTDSDWFDGTGNTETVGDLDPDTEYEVVVRVKDGNGTKLTGKTKVSKRVGTDSGIDPKTGDGYIDVTANPDTKYAVLDKGGNPATGVKVYDGAGNELTPDDKGWYNVGTEQVITFEPLLPGTEYEVVSVPKNDTSTPNEASQNGNGKEVTVPAVGDNAGVSEGTTDDTVKITIDPSSTGVKYAVVDPDTSEVVGGAGGWKQGGGVVVFDNLAPGKEYVVVTVPTGETNPPTSGLDSDDGQTIATPTLPLPTVAPGNTGRTDNGDGTDTITLTPTDADKEYAVRNPETGEISEWKQGGGTLDFEVESDEVYEVVTRIPEGTTVGTPPNETVTTTPSLPALPGIVIGPVVPTDKVKGTGETDANGKTAITIDPADPNLDYGVVDGSGNVIDGWKGVNPDGTVTLEGLTPGTEYTVVTKPKDNPATDPSEVGGGTVITSPPVAVDDIEREEAGDGTETLTFTPDSGYEYTVVPKGTNPANGDWIKGDANGNVTTGGGVVITVTTGPDGKVIVTGLETDTDYEVLIRVPETGGKVSIPNVTEVPTLLDITGEYDKTTGKAQIVIDSADPEKKYAVVDSNGNIVGTPASFQSGDANGQDKKNCPTSSLK